MRVNFNSQYSEIMSEIRTRVRKYAGASPSVKVIYIDSRLFKIERIVSVICKAEIVACFLSNQTGIDDVKVSDILQLFRITTNSDIPYFNNIDKEMVAKMQNTLFNWTYKNSVEQTFAEYDRYPKEWRIADVIREEKKLYSIKIKRDAYSNNRLKLYLECLNKSLPHANRGKSFENIDKMKIFTNKELYYFDQDANEEKCIFINDELMSYAKRTFNATRLCIEAKHFEEVRIDLNEMKKWAMDIDLLDKHMKQNNDWENRIKDLILSIPTNTALEDRNSIIVNGMLHAVGALSVGKSTFITVCTYGLAKKGKRISLFLNTVTDVLKMVDYLNQLDIKTVPLLSTHQISKHANQYLSTLKSHHEMFQKRSSFKYICDSCMLLNSEIRLEDEYNTSRPPCNNLYAKPEDNKKKNENIICPFISICNRFNNIRDLNDAQVIVSTINSAIQSYLPEPFTSVQMTILEYIIRTCDLAFIDESDQVQASLDSLFCQSINIYGGSDIFYKATKNRVMEYNESGDVPDNEHILDFIRGTSNVEFFTTNVTNFLTTTKDVDKLFNRDIYNYLIKSQLLWRDLFEQAVGVNINSLEEFEKDEELKTQYLVAQKAFGKAFENFQKGLLRGEVPLPNDEVSYNLRAIASNLADESKLLSDLEGFANLKLYQLLIWEDEEVNSPQQFKRLSGLYDNWNKPLSEVVSRVIEKLRFIMDLYMLEHKLKFVLEKWELVRVLDNKMVNSKSKYPGSLKQEFAGIVPALPIDMNYGFIINKEQNGRMHIKYINLEGIGRWILLNFDKLYRDLDGVKINCILLSGTSNMKTSPKYNVDLPVGCLIRKSHIKKSKLLMYYPVSITSKISGAKRSKGSNKLLTLTDNLFDKGIDPNGRGYLPLVYDRLPEGRKRVLFSLGSYDDCRVFSDKLNTYMENSFNLSRAQDIRGRGHKEIERGKIEDVVKYDINALSIPLGIGRGYNIITEVVDFLNDSKSENSSKSVAALGAAFFIKRPFYVPNDINTMIAWLNCTYVGVINQYKMGVFSDYSTFQSKLIGRLYGTQTEYENMYGYTSLPSSCRDRLLGDTIVDVFQLSCRLIRGNVDAEIHFLDSSFAPNTIETSIKADTEKTSMIIGWRTMLRDLIQNSKNQALGEIYEELYQILLDGLNMIQLKERN